MTTRKSYKTEICAECKNIIPPGTQFAVIQVPAKNILFTELGKNIFGEKILCLEHVYKGAEKIRTKQFSFLGVK